MKMAWLLGWAVPVAWFAPLVRENFPHDEHLYFQAGPNAVEQMQTSGPFDRVIGYSLGAHLLLAAAARGISFENVSLLAPIFAFAREENLGGRVARTQVRVLARRLRQDQPVALADFYSRAGLNVPEVLTPKDESDNLLWGLERLECDRVAPPIPAGWRAWCGADDALLDATQLRAIAPEIKIVPQATHHLAALLRAMAEETK